MKHKEKIKILSITMLMVILLFQSGKCLSIENATTPFLNLTIAPHGSNKMVLAWNAGLGIDQYKVYRSCAYHGQYQMIADTSGTTMTDTVNAGARYYYQVKAYVAGEWKLTSPIASSKITKKGTPATLPIGKVNGIKTSSNHLILVTVKNKHSTLANFSYYIKSTTGTWILELEAIAYVGKNGIGKKKEGDMKTPTGRYGFSTAFGAATKPAGTTIPYVKINQSHWLVSDRNSKYYNCFVSTSKKASSPQVKQVTKDWRSIYGEHLINYPTTYQYALILNYNPKNTKGKGSAIFLHCYSNRKYTSGCITIPQYKEKYLIKMLGYNQNSIDATIIINTDEKMKNY